MDRILEEIVPYLPMNAQNILNRLSPEEQRNLREIRMKEGCPFTLFSESGRRYFPEAIHLKDDLERTFRRLCASSAYTHRNEIRAGYVTLPGGHRVGILGTAVISDSCRVEGMRDIYGLVFRIAREFPISVNSLVGGVLKEGRIRNLLLAGPPCSGKTTVLRALSKALAEQVQVSVIDEREELFPAVRSVPVGCDVLRGYPKSIGILQALRTLNPRVIVCDEIGTSAEIQAMTDGLRSGVGFVVSAHAFEESDLLHRPPIRRLILGGMVDLIAFLDPQKVGTVKYVKERTEMFYERNSATDGFSALCRNRDCVRLGPSGTTTADCSDAGTNSILS